MIIYLLAFYLFDDIKKNIKITHANHFATSNAFLTKLLVQPERLYFLFAFFAQGIVYGNRRDRKTPKTIVLFT